MILPQNVLFNPQFLKSIRGPYGENTIIFTNGCFDLFHVGHIRLLQLCKSGRFGHEFGRSVLIVGVNSDESVKAIKGNSRPAIPCDQRMEMVDSLSEVDYTFSFDYDCPISCVQILKPNILVKGEDWQSVSFSGRSVSFPERDFVESYGGRVEFAPLARDKHGEIISTTSIYRKTSITERMAKL